MTRIEASSYLRDKLNHYGLTDWSVRLSQNAESRFLGMCSHKDKTIILNAHHIDIHPTPDVKNTILHEVAHALTPGHAHNDVWVAKAREIGCDNTMPCSNLSLSPDVIDAIRSGADVEVTFDEQVIRTPKYTITRLQDKCEICGKVAVSKSEKISHIKNPKKPDLKFITLECGHIIVRKIPKGTPFHSFQMGGDPNCEHDWDKNNCLKCNRKRPYPFQLEGMKFLETGLSVNKGAACFDDMGLGKTIQAGGVVFFHPLELQPCLWIVKNATKYQTASFLLNWLGDDHVPQVINSSKTKLWPGMKHYIIGYDMLVPKTRTLKNGTKVNSGFDITEFDRVGIKCVILDECQQIKNVDSSRTQMVRRIVRDRKVIPLSGTPWNNRGSELFPVLNMIAPMKFPSEARFRRDWVDTYYVGNIIKEGGIRRIPQFKEFTKDLCIRRERVEVMPELPLTNRTKLEVILDDTNEAIYDEAVEQFVKWYESESADMGSMAIIAAMAKMRHLVALAKVPATLEYVDEFVEDTDRKLVVFAHHKDVQEILFAEIKQKHGGEFPVYQITADMNPLERFEVQEKFNADKRAIIVASQLAAGEGINLQTCSDCVMHERQWNPGKEQQCEDRFARIGSTAEVVNAVYAHMVGLTAIDSQLDAIVERKRIQFHAVHNAGEAQKWNEDSIMKELAASIVAAHNAKKNREIVAKRA
jgi:superfamily II DNA or RNA helicase